MTFSKARIALGIALATSLVCAGLFIIQSPDASAGIDTVSPDNATGCAGDDSYPKACLHLVGTNTPQLDYVQVGIQQLTGDPGETVGYFHLWSNDKPQTVNRNVYSKAQPYTCDAKKYSWWPQTCWSFKIHVKRFHHPGTQVYATLYYINKQGTAWISAGPAKKTVWWKPGVTH